MDVREKLFTLFQDCNNPSWKWFPNNAEMMKLIDYLIAHGVTAQEWISVKDKLPEKSGKYIVCSRKNEWEEPNMYQAKFYRYVSMDGGHWGQKDKGKNITHWMPLPAPPKGE